MTTCPGFVVAAPTSGQGKTIITLGLLRALKRQGLAVASAKVGPDYIDPAFHAAAGGGLCINLDPWAMTGSRVQHYAQALGTDADLIVCEGVMGLFDGATLDQGSTADLAATLDWPIILVVSGQSVGASAAAIVRGFATHRSGLEIAGVIFNRVGSDRHAEILTEAMREALPGIPVLGCVRRNPDMVVPERHLGLVQAGEHEDLNSLLDAAADAVEREVDLAALTGLARQGCMATAGGLSSAVPPLGQHIAVARDAAFGFCYPHILSDWAEAGATITLFSPLADQAPDPAADAVYLPGGYPELHGAELAASETFLKGLAQAAEAGKAIFGECGGYMVLGEAIIDASGDAHPMADLLPLVTSFQTPKLHLGYRMATLCEDTALGPKGAQFAAHEFHYASIVSMGPGDALFTATNATGQAHGAVGQRRGSVFGSFMHLIAGQDLDGPI